MNSNTVGELDSKIKALNICKEFLTGPWKSLTLEDFVFEKISGGLTNVLYRCALPNSLTHNTGHHGRGSTPKEVLMRIYGPLQEDNNVAIQESVVFTILSERNLGPKLYGIFKGGRLEEYVPSRTANCDDFPTICVSVAEEMAKIHSLQVPISKNPVYREHIDTYLAEIESNKTGNVPTVISSGEFRNEVSWLDKKIEEICPKIVFCHNDLLGGNILLLNNPEAYNGKQLFLIDFEFSGYNYRGFDIGNYFGENCLLYKTTKIPLTYEVDFEKYPSKGEQMEFIAAYLMQLQKEGEVFENDFQTEVEKLLKEVAILGLAANLHCSACSFRMAVNPPVDFPFQNHGYSKWNSYKRFKEIAIKDGFLSQ